MSLDIARFRDFILKLHLGALPAPLIALLSYILSPEFLNVLPEKYSKVGYTIAGVVAVVAPALLKKDKVSPAVTSNGVSK